MANILHSYELNGKKLSFANWISNITPDETPFSSMTGKESIQQTLFQWQTDDLPKAAKNAQIEGGDATSAVRKSTIVLNNVTQILRKALSVSDTANATANYGRGKELQYQMEKASKELKLDLELALLANPKKVVGTSSAAGETAGFLGLCAYKGFPTDDKGFNPSVDGETCPATGAITVRLAKGATTGGYTLNETDLWDMTLNLYTAGSKANIIMYNPMHAHFFSALQESGANRSRIFENSNTVDLYVSTVIDPLGREYKLIPNRQMPADYVYFFNASDWTQMVLRAPKRTQLAKTGSSENWMLEMEVGLRHRNPYASGVLILKKGTAPTALKAK